MSDDQKEFMGVQIHKIEIDKWVQGECQDSDPGEEYVLDWVYYNAKNFRDEWNLSLCKTCSFHRECGWNATGECDLYVEGDFNEKNTMP